jgi:hypothetical protein
VGDRRVRDKSRGDRMAGVVVMDLLLTSQSARAPVTELEGTAGVTNVGHGHDVDEDVDATKR